MLISRLGSAASYLSKINRPKYTVIRRNFARKLEIDEDDRPIPYSTSPAATWKAEHSRYKPRDAVWYTPHVVMTSVAVFMLYFCVFREENDIDLKLYRPLNESIKGFDESIFNQDPKSRDNQIPHLTQKKVS